MFSHTFFFLVLYQPSKDHMPISILYSLFFAFFQYSFIFSLCVFFLSSVHFSLFIIYYIIYSFSNIILVTLYISTSILIIILQHVMCFLNILLLLLIFSMITYCQMIYSFLYIFYFSKSTIITSFFQHPSYFSGSNCKFLYNILSFYTMSF